MLGKYASPLLSHSVTIPIFRTCTSLLQVSGMGSGLGCTPPKTTTSPRQAVQEWYDRRGPPFVYTHTNMNIYNKEKGSEKKRRRKRKWRKRKRRGREGVGEGEINQER